MIKTFQKAGYTFLIDFLIMPVPVGGGREDSITCIEKIMAGRGIEIKASQWINTCVTSLAEQNIVSANNIAGRLLAMGLDIIVRFPLMLLTYIPLSIFLATKFIFSFTAFAIFYASTNQKERQDAGVQMNQKQALAAFALEYMIAILVLPSMPFACLLINVIRHLGR